jgi:hypothetical protein
LRANKQGTAAIPSIFDRTTTKLIDLKRHFHIIIEPFNQLNATKGPINWL